MWMGSVGPGWTFPAFLLAPIWIEKLESRSEKRGEKRRRQRRSSATTLSLAVIRIWREIFGGRRTGKRQKKASDGRHDARNPDGFNDPLVH